MEELRPLTGRPTVMVVDDDPSLRRLFAQALRFAGFDVVEAPDGSEALRLAMSEDLSAVLLDSRMPAPDGLEVLRRLRANAATATLPVILVTGLSDVADRVEGFEAGANDYVVKPVDLDELVARVRGQLRAQTAWKELFEASLRRRLEVAATLGDIDPADEPVEIAASICRTLTELEEVLEVTVYEFLDGGLVLPLASSPASGALTPGDAGPLLPRARQGPWTEAGDGTGRRVFAPLGPPVEPLGLLVLRLAPAAGGTAAVLPAAVDCATVVTTLLRPALGRRVRTRGAAAELTTIARERRFSTVFQPVLDLRTRRAIGFEALTRFDDGVRPDHRLADAARLQVQREMQTELVVAAVERSVKLPGGAWLGLNLSAGVLTQSPDLQAVLRAVDRPVVIELTEHEQVDDYAEVRRVIDTLRPDVRLAVDDAGAGYASLRHVLALAPDFVKLDTTWVQGIDGDPSRQALVASLIHFAHRTSSELIAEGIEREEELDMVVRLGIDFGQGYLLGRPAPIQGSGGSRPRTT